MQQGLAKPVGEKDKLDAGELKKREQQSKMIEMMIFQKMRPNTRENILKSQNLNQQLQDENQLSYTRPSQNQVVKLQTQLHFFKQKRRILI